MYAQFFFVFIFFSTDASSLLVFSHSFTLTQPRTADVFRMLRAVGIAVVDVCDTGNRAVLGLGENLGPVREEEVLG